MHRCDTSLRFRLSHRERDDNGVEDHSSSWMDGGSSSQYLVVTGHGPSEERKTDDDDDPRRSSQFVRSQGFIDLSPAIQEASKMHIDESLNTYHDSVYLDKMHDPDAVRKRWYSPRELQNFVDRVVHRVERFCEDNEKSSSPRMAAIRAIEHAYRYCCEMAVQDPCRKDEPSNTEEDRLVVSSLKHAYAAHPEMVGLETYIAEYMETFPDPIHIKREYRRRVIQWYRGDDQPENNQQRNKLTSSLFPRSSKNKNKQMNLKQHHLQVPFPESCRSTSRV